jgi:Family of unknown function (DUF6326)
MSDDHPVNPRLIVASLWTSMLFVFAYVDIFGFFRADVLQASLAGKVAVFEVNQTFLALTTLYILIPALMVFLTLVLPSKVNRWLNILLAVVYALSIIASCIGETWIYYLLGSGIEVVLLAMIAWRSWRTL